MSEIKLSTPLNSEELEKLSIGDKVFLSGKIYTARDAAHKRLAQLIKEEKELPFSLEGQVIYYVGPAPAKPGQVVGSAGPTTSERMDPYTPLLLAHGLKGMIGKGPRSQEVIDAIQRYKAVYFAATGGVGVLLAKAVKSSKVVAYEDLGAEAIRELEVVDLPLIVAIDTSGQDLYQKGVSQYCLP